MSIWRAFFVLAGIAVMVFVLFRSRSDVRQDPETKSSKARDQQELIFKLQYIGRDYQFAVADGKIINEFEFAEMGAFCQRVLELYLQFQPSLTQNEIVFQLQQLRQMVFEKADRYAILDLTKSLIRELTAELQMDSTPDEPPNLARGKSLYRSGGCDVCHGTSGAGDGRAAAWLDPGPGSFRESEGMREATPYQFFNAIQLGVIGTGMPAYEEAYSRQEAWVLAFYLMTLREGFNPQEHQDLLDVTLEDLATQSDADLLLEMSERESTKERDPEAISATLDYLRSRPEILK